MKRSQLKRRPKPRVHEPGRDVWKEPRSGFCQVCDRFAMHLHHHHVYPERLVRQEGADPWVPANGMYVCERDHMNHHAAFRRIPLEKVPVDAVDFVYRLLGEDRACLFFERFYGCERQAA